MLLLEALHQEQFKKKKLEKKSGSKPLKLLGTCLWGCTEPMRDTQSFSIAHSMNLHAEKQRSASYQTSYQKPYIVEDLGVTYSEFW